MYNQDTVYDQDTVDKISNYTAFSNLRLSILVLGFLSMCASLTVCICMFHVMPGHMSVFIV